MASIWARPGRVVAEAGGAALLPASAEGTADATGWAPGSSSSLGCRGRLDGAGQLRRVEAREEAAKFGAQRRSKPIGT